MRVLGLVALVACSSCVHFVHVPQLVSARAGSGDVLFHDVDVFTGTERTLLAHQDVRTHGDRIVSVLPTEALGNTTGLEVIEGAGKTLMPGLVDAHGHPAGTASPFYYLEVPDPEHNLQAHLFVGVTTVYSPCGDPVLQRKLVQKMKAGDILGPQLFYSGKMITHLGGYPVSMMDELLPPILAGNAEAQFVDQVSNPAEARKVAQKNLDEGASFLKVGITHLPNLDTPRLTQDEIQAIADVAHASGKLLVAHVDSAEDALLALHSGVDALWHNVQLDRLTLDQLAELKRMKAVVPTIHTFDVFEEFVDGTFKPTELLTLTETPAMVQAMAESGAHIKETPPSLLKWIERLKKNHEGRYANVKALHDVGVPLLVGTDANGSDGSFPAHIHDEMKQMHNVGIENADILLGATSRGAAFLFGDNADFGTVQAGKRADLLLVKGNPIEDISTTANIELVMANGRLLDRNLKR